MINCSFKPVFLTIGLVLTFEIAWSQKCMLENVFFDKNKYMATAEIEARFDSLINGWSKDSVYVVQIHGYTDTSNSSHYNWALANKRIGTVAALIRSRRKERIIIETENHGELDGKLWKGPEWNRRAEVKYLAIGGDSTITSEGPGGERITIAYRDFPRLLICDCGLSFGFEKTAENGLGLLRYDVRCGEVSRCLPSVLHIPFDAFLDNKDRDVPLPLEFDLCKGFDVEFGYAPYEKQLDYSVRKDLKNREYVIKMSCYGPGTVICCGTKDCKPDEWIIYPEKGLAKELGCDSLVIPANQVRRSATYFNSCVHIRGDLYWLTVNPDTLQRRRVDRFVSPYSCVAVAHLDRDNADIGKLFSSRQIAIKFPFGSDVDSVQMRILEGGFIFPLEYIGKRSYSGAKLRPQFDFVFYVGGRDFKVSKSKLKRRTRNKAGVTQYKLRCKAYKKIVNEGSGG